MDKVETFHYVRDYRISKDPVDIHFFVLQKVEQGASWAELADDTIVWCLYAYSNYFNQILVHALPHLLQFDQQRPVDVQLFNVKHFDSHSNVLRKTVSLTSS